MRVRGLVSTTLLMVIALMWWLANVPYAAAGLVAIGTATPIAWTDAIFLPAAGTV
ncbi:hypothetical protein ACFVYP_36035 [Kitasatospora sp. NPDC058201]|uniref:hypothetical protein n=1 Tax=unclassified Kitasatospora TaxID=2633591 RepID=UPI0036592A8F